MAGRPRGAALALLVAVTIAANGVVRSAEAQNVCAPGTGYNQQQRSCVACTGNTVGAGGPTSSARCVACAVATVPNVARSACISGCPAGQGLKLTQGRNGRAALACTNCNATAMISAGGANATCANCTAGFIAAPNGTVCITACAPGQGFNATAVRCGVCNATATSPGGAAPCRLCSNGTLPNANQTACLAGCPAGFGLAAGRSGAGQVCAPCAATNQVSRGGFNATCATCPAGQVPWTNSSICVPDCRAGSGLTPNFTCSACAAGTVSAGGRNVCTGCLVNTVPNLNASACVAGCPPGQGVGSRGCAACTGVTASAGGPGAVCAACPASTVPNAGRTACVASSCPAGNGFNATSGTCSPCGANSTSPGGATSAARCTTCAAGFVANAARTLCVPAACPPGTGYNNATNACVACTGNTTSPGGSLAASVCRACGLGTIANANRTECILPVPSSCPAGTFLNGTACRECAGNTTSPGGPVTSAVCTPCAVGTIANKNKTACVTPPATSCPPGNALVSGACQACSNTSVSAGGTATSCTACTGGQVANANRTVCITPLSCLPGFASTNGTCAACAQGAASNGGTAPCVACANGTYPNADQSACLAAGSAFANVDADYTTLSTGVTDSSVAFPGVSFPADLFLRGGAFPILLNAAGRPLCAAGRTPWPGGGRVVACGKEEFLSDNRDAATMASPASRWLVNQWRWASGTSGDAVRVVGKRNDAAAVQPSGLARMNASAVPLGFSFVPGDGWQGRDYPWELDQLSQLVARSDGSTTRVADLLVLVGNPTYSDADIAAVIDHLKAGGGLVIACEGWSFGGNNADLPSNRLLAAANLIRWGDSFVDWGSPYPVSAAAPSPLRRWNRDAGAAELDAHLGGGAQMDASALDEVTNSLVDGIKRAATIDVVPIPNDPSSLWMGFNSSLAKRALAATASWQCGAVPSNPPLNRLAAAYIGAMNRDLPAARMHPAPCAGTFPSLGVDLAADTTPISAVITASYPAQSTVLPPNRDSVWLSTGAYASPGAAITVTLPAGVTLSADQLIGVQIGAHDADLSSKETWCRQPWGATKSVWFTSSTGRSLSLASNQGGPVYIVVKRGNVFGQLTITLAGAARMPFFQKGITTNAEWASVGRSRVAPFAELASGRAVLTVPSSLVRSVSDAASIVELYDSFMGAFGELAGYNDSRPNNDRVVVDCDTDGNRPSGSYPYFIRAEGVPDLLRVAPSLANAAQWNLLREWGRGHQLNAMTPDSFGEPNADMYALYAMEKVASSGRSLRFPLRRSAGAKYLSGVEEKYPGWNWWDRFNGQYCLMNLMEGIAPGNPEGGWAFWRRMIATFSALEGTLTDDGEKRQRLILEASKLANQDLTTHFEAWFITVDASTKSAISALNLPPISFNVSNPCGGGGVDTCTSCCAHLYNSRGNYTFEPNACPPGTRVAGGGCAPCTGNSSSPGGDSTTAVCSPCPGALMATGDKTRCVATAALEEYTSDWAVITSGVVGQSLTWGPIGNVGQILLSGNAFPILVTTKGHVMGAAARVNEGGGRVVAFVEERFSHSSLGADSLKNTATERWLLNLARWVSGTNGSTVRIVGLSGATDFNVANLNARAAADGLGFTFVPADGKAADSDKWQVPTASQVITREGGRVSRIADLYVALAGAALSEDDVLALQDFVRAGGGIIWAGEAWSFDKPAAQYPANQVVYPFNIMLWTRNYNWDGADASYPIGAPPVVGMYNPEVTAAEIERHFTGVATMPADQLMKSAKLLGTTIRNSDNITNTPVGSSAAAVWRGFNSSLARRALDHAATWDCAAGVNSSVPLNWIAVSYIARLNYDLPPDSTPASPCAQRFPNLGLTLTPDPSPVTVSVNLFYRSQPNRQPWPHGHNYVSTGIWAPAGVPVTITVGSNVPVNRSIAVVIGAQSDELLGKDKWCRQPVGTQKLVEFTADTGRTLRVASTMGGPIWIGVRQGIVLGASDITVTNGVRMPYFKLGQHTNAEWASTIKNYPAPFAEFATDQVVLTVPSTAARKVTDPEGMMVMYDALMDVYPELAVYGTPKAPYNQRMVLDCDIGGGWMHSGYPAMGYLEVADEMLTLSPGQYNDAHWGLLHEWGHNHQIGEMTIPGTGEVTCNLWAILGIERVTKVDRTQRFGPNRARDVAAFWKGDGAPPPAWDLGIGLIHYSALMEGLAPGNPEAGWDYMKKLMLTYQTLSMGSDDPTQRWIIEASKAAGVNLVPFFEQWRFSVSADTKSRIAALNLGPVPFNISDPCGGTAGIDTCNYWGAAYYNYTSPWQPTPATCTAGNEPWNLVCRPCQGMTVSASGAKCTACVGATRPNTQRTACV